MAVQPTYQQVEEAIGTVPGVASADVGVSDTTGRGRLRIRLQPEQDPDVVSRAVAATLRSRFGIDIDPSEIRPRPTHEQAEDLVRVPGGPPAAEPAAPSSSAAAAGLDLGRGIDPLGGRSPHFAPPGIDDPERPVLRDLSTRSEGLEVTVEAVVERIGRSVTGRSRSVATRCATLRAIAEATLGAVEELCEGLLRAGVERIDFQRSGDDEFVTVVVSLLTSRFEDRLVGAALVRGSREQAVMRATMDAVNRRAGLFLDD